MTYVSRTVLGGCIWYTLPEVQPQEDALKKADPFTYADFKGMKEDASGEGGLRTATWVEELDYRVPLTYAPDGVSDPPWTGEFKKQGKRRRGKAGLEWRMYFCEPTDLDNLVVVCGLSSKDPADLKASASQQDAIRKAMNRFKGHCRQLQIGYPPFESNP